ncbi:hypothetical protein G4B88_004357 [Cannabis sativa]|uniref:Small ribosomal subunit protein uS15c n=1 Tax=Cannabis sativa TaxID=3483 RepID=A0A7J6HZV4_CANSA|nr:hypothetical protein G4B88_004357 [Cannabis sativa]
MLIDIPINNYRVEENIIDIKTNPDRKFFDLTILNYCLRNKIYIGAWVDIDTHPKSNKYTKTWSNNYQLIEKIDEKGLIKPCAIPIKSLLLNFNENVRENKSTAENKKRNIFLTIFSKNKNQREKEFTVQENLDLTLSNQEKDIEENYALSKMKKNKKQYKNNMEAGFDFLLKRYLLFQLRWDNSLNTKMIANIKVYCLLLRLINPRDITIASIQRGEMSLDILMIQKKCKSYRIGISVRHKSTHTINQRYREKEPVDKKNFDEVISKHQKMAENRDKNHYDLFVPETILAPRRRIELRILICFNSRNQKGMLRNTTFCNENKIKKKVLNTSKRDKKKNAKKEENKGSVVFQILSLTNRIRKLSSHLELHRKDYLSQRCLRKILGKCQRMLSYLSKKNRILNMGPQHPSMHGVLRLIVTLDGEDVIDCEPILGYSHRGMEKIAENQTIIQYLPYVTRWDYLATMFTEAITVNGPKLLGNIQVPKRASYIRAIMLELSRIASHLLWLGPFMTDIGAQTPFFYIFRERVLSIRFWVDNHVLIRPIHIESLPSSTHYRRMLEVYDLFEAATSMRMMHNYFSIGGVATDLPHGWIDKCLDFCDYFLTGVTEYQKLITRNPIFLERVEGVGIIGREDVINWGLSGPMLRASGIQWDLRKVNNYECYDEFDWEVQWQKQGDSLARYLVRIGEMTESIKIIQQALEGIPGGPYENLEIRDVDRERKPEWNDFDYRFISKKSSPKFELPKQELYVRVEAPKGELGIFLIGDQSGFPWRWKIRPPGFINVKILPQLVKRMKLADIITILGSIDIIMGEVDR